MTEPSLKGYRALWQYLAGAAASYGERSGVAAMAARARSHFANARDAAGGIRWLSNWPASNPEHATAHRKESVAIRRSRGWKHCYSKLGTGHHARYAKHEKEILDRLASTNSTQFETAHRDLGEMLGSARVNMSPTRPLIRGGLRDFLHRFRGPLECQSEFNARRGQSPSG